MTEMNDAVFCLGCAATGGGPEDQSRFKRAIAKNNAVMADDGAMGRALEFEEGAFVRVDDHDALNPSAGITLAAWVKPFPGYGEMMPRILFKVRGEAGYALYLCPRVYPAGEGVIKAAFAINGKIVEVATDAGIPINKWSHVAASYDGQAIRLFINGEMKVFDPRKGALTPALKSPLFIGGNGDRENSRSFFGLLDEVCVLGTGCQDVSRIIKAGKREKLLFEKDGPARVNVFFSGLPAAAKTAGGEDRARLSDMFSIPVRWDSGNPLSFINDYSVQLALDEKANSLVLEYVASPVLSNRNKVVVMEPDNLEVLEKNPSLRLIAGVMPWWNGGLKTRKGLPLKIHPDFLNEFMITHEGVSVKDTGGEFSMLSFWGSATRQFARNCILDRIGKYKGVKQVIGWTLPSFQGDANYQGGTKEDIVDYSSWSQANYRRWLRVEKRYDLDGLNAKYGTAFKSWDEVTQPQPRKRVVDLRPAWKEFQEFRRWTVKEWYRELICLARKEDPSRNVFRLYVAGGIRPDIVCIYEDYFSLLDELGVYGYVENTCGDNASAMMVKHCSLFYKHGLSSCEPGDFYKTMYQAIRFGYDMAFLKWIPPYIGQSRSPLNFDKIGKYRPAFSGCTGGMPVLSEKRVGLLYSYHTAFSSLLIRDQGADMLNFAFEQEYPFVYLSDLMPLDDLMSHDCIVAANALILPEGVVSRLESHVREGGRLVLLGGSGFFSTQDTDETHPSFRLIRELGFEGELFRERKHAGRVRVTQKNDLFSSPGFNLHSGWRMKPSSSWAHEAWANWEDGSPSIIKWSHGKGEVILVAGTPPLRVFGDMMVKAGCGKTVESSDYEIKGGVVDKGGDRMVVLFNSSDKEREAKVAFSGHPSQSLHITDLKTGETCPLPRKSSDGGMSLCLEPKECRVLRISGKLSPGGGGIQTVDGNKTVAANPVSRPDGKDKVLRFTGEFDHPEKGAIFFYLRGFNPPLDIRNSFLEYDIWLPENHAGYEAAVMLTGNMHAAKATLPFLPGVTHDVTPGIFKNRVAGGKWEHVKIDLSKFQGKQSPAVLLTVDIVDEKALGGSWQACFRNLALTNGDGGLSIDLLRDQVTAPYDRARLREGYWPGTFCWSRRRWFKDASARFESSGF